MSRAATLTSGPRHRLLAIGMLVLIASGVLSGCGSSSSKPAYCADVTNFKTAVAQLTKVTSPSGLATQAQKVASTGQTLLSAVKTDFAAQTAPVKSALATLQNSVKQLLSSSTRATAIAAIPGEAQALGTAAENLFTAAHPKCT